MVFKQMSINGNLYGDFNASCLGSELKERSVTNFDMVSDELSQIMQDRDKQSQEFKDAEMFLYHLAICHTIVSSRNPRNEEEITLNASSPDELALLNAAKYYGIRFTERIRDDIVVSDDWNDS